MASIKKISELGLSENLEAENIDFLVVDKSITSGIDASLTGKTSRVTLSQILNSVEVGGPKGDKGDAGEIGEKGSIGADGATGLPGSKGEKGDTGESGEKGIQGERGFQGDVGLKGPKGPSGEQGIQGIQGPIGSPGSPGETGQKGQKGEVGEKGKTSSVNSSLNLVTTSNVILDSTQNKISKVAGANGWNGQVMSSVGFNTFNLGFSVSQRNKKMAIGVSVSNTSSHINPNPMAMFLAFYFESNGTYRVLNQGRTISSSSISYSPSSIFNLSFDKLRFTITQDGRTVGSFGFSGTPPPYTYSFDSAFFDVGTDLTKFISFIPGANSVQGNKGDAGQKGQKGETGSGQKGQKGILGPEGVKGDRGYMGQKGQKGDFQKGQKGETGPRGYQGQKGPMGQKGNAAPTFAWRNVPNQSKVVQIRRSSNMYPVLDVGSFGVPASATKVVLDIRSGESYVYRWAGADWRIIHAGVNNGSRHNRVTIPLERDHYHTSYRNERQVQLHINFAPGDDRDCHADIRGVWYYGPA